MTQQELNEAVARATNEDLSEIRRMGFIVADPALVNFDPEPTRKRRYIDWDEINSQRSIAWS